jgi:poly(3-hydroxyalkanoate) depolymerase
MPSDTPHDPHRCEQVPTAPPPAQPIPGNEVRDLRISRRMLRAHIRVGRGTPLVACTGIGTGPQALDPLIDQLDPRTTIIRFELPVSAATPEKGVRYSFPLLVRWIGDALTQLGYSRSFDALGYSWGGALAQQLALQNPGRCRRLVLIATATGALMVPARPRVLAKMLTSRRFTEPGYLAAAAAELYGGHAADHPEVLARLHRPPSAEARREYMSQLLAAATWTSLFTLHAIRQPTLVIAGTDDPLIPLINARIMTRLLPNATLHIHPGGHLEPMITPEQFAPIINKFLQ